MDIIRKFVRSVLVQFMFLDAGDFVDMDHAAVSGNDPVKITLTEYISNKADEIEFYLRTIDRQKVIKQEVIADIAHRFKLTKMLTTEKFVIIFTNNTILLQILELYSI